MNDTTVINLALGALAPVVISLINQHSWSPKVKAAVALLFCFAAAAGIEAWRGTLTWVDWRATVVALTGAAIVSYRTFWQPSTIAPAIEAATTVVSPTAPYRPTPPPA